MELAAETAPNSNVLEPLGWNWADIITPTGAQCQSPQTQAVQDVFGFPISLLPNH